MPHAVNIALFGFGASNSWVSILVHALGTLSQRSPSQTFCRFAVHQPTLSEDGSLSDSDFQLCFLQGNQNGSATDSDTHAEEKIRHALSKNKLSYQVVYGSADDQFEIIVAQVVLRLAKESAFMDVSQRIDEQWKHETLDATKAWTHTCETCGDPTSERRLLSHLIAGRGPKI